MSVTMTEFFVAGCCQQSQTGLHLRLCVLSVLLFKMDLFSCSPKKTEPIEQEIAKSAEKK
jgi:hypothetical protein